MLNKINRNKIDKVLERAVNDTPQMISIERAFSGETGLESIKPTDSIAELEEIIKSYINVQYALATYVMSGLPAKSHVIGFIQSVPVILQVEVVKKVFGEVTAYGIKEKIIGLYVKQPSEAAIQAFKNLHAAGELNKWIAEITKEHANDVNEKVSYEYVREQSDVQIEDFFNMVSEFAQDEFVLYLRSNERNRLTNKSVRTGSTIDDVGNALFVRLLSEIVGSVYVYTEEESIPGEGKRFVKYITWTEVGQSKKAGFPIGLGLFILAVTLTYLKSLWFVAGLIVFSLIVARIDLKCIAIKKEQLGEGSEEWARFRKKKIIAYGIACGILLYSLCSHIWYLILTLRG